MPSICIRTLCPIFEKTSYAGIAHYSNLQPFMTQQKVLKNEVGSQRQGTTSIRSKIFARTPPSSRLIFWCFLHFCRIILTCSVSIHTKFRLRNCLEFLWLNLQNFSMWVLRSLSRFHNNYLRCKNLFEFARKLLFGLLTFITVYWTSTLVIVPFMYTPIYVYRPVCVCFFFRLFCLICPLLYAGLVVPGGRCLVRRV